MLSFLIKGVFRDRHRYLFPLLIVSSGVLIMVFMLALINGYMDSFIRQNAGFDTGHLKVVTAAYSRLLSQKPYDLGLLDIQDELATWKAAYPQLDWVERIHFGALLDVPDNLGQTREQGEVVAFGIDLLSSGRERKLMHLDQALVSGRIPSQSSEILLTDSAFRRLALKLGDPVTLIGSDVFGSMTFRQFRVTGSVRFGVEALDRGAVIVDLADARGMLDMEGGAGEILAFFRNGSYDQKAAEQIRDDFNRRFGDMETASSGGTQTGKSAIWEEETASSGGTQTGKSAIQSESSAIRDEYAPVMLAMSDQNNMGYMLGMMQYLLAIFSLVFIFILGIVLWNSGLMNGIRRYGEIGVRLAIGESKTQIYRSLLIEAGAIGFAGSVLGILLGLLLSAYFNLKGMDVSVFSRNSSLLSEDIIYTSVSLKTALSALIPGMLSTLLGAALAGMAVFKRQTSQLFKELET
ncbi:MAG TPA: FtsX-like permease family protein [Candidatus Cloacimonadota bacterium]|nr:FtsX-like permease family protein [Candidatus Cloacimonadota bacterium]